ncbi:GNAT family N-acetyltransferase [Pseudoalteromonas citrea]|nr:GNAT family N-acetyltransferase [Pseudoalteromonas citrea]
MSSMPDSHTNMLNHRLHLKSNQLGTVVFHNCLILQKQPDILKMQDLILFLDEIFHNHQHITHIQLSKSSWPDCEASQALSKHINIRSFSKYEFYNCPLFLSADAQKKHAILDQSTVIKSQINLSGELYNRKDLDIDQVISFKVIDPKTDLALFHQWMNNPRVAEFWDQAWSEEALHNYLKEKLDSPFELPLIGCFNDIPFGYFEVYWASQDRIAPYYPWQSFDRGLHLLIGNESFRGSRYFKAWCKAISHFIFLDDMRTQKIVLEPRHDNHRLFTQIQKLGFKKEFEFDFPHKRAALTSIQRAEFFNTNFSC